MLLSALLTYPIIDPIAVQIGPVPIRWYSLAYIAGIILGFYYIKRLMRRDGAPLLGPEVVDNMPIWAIIGIILGGRLGYVLFYKPAYYLEHIAEIPAIWQGGMSFHGGMIGLALSFYIFVHRHNVSYRGMMDLLCAAAPIGLFFGRIANFINGELYGRVTDAPLGMVFPTGGALPRHPSQLYEAFFEGLVLFIIIAFLIHKREALFKRGRIAGVFLVGYGSFRFIIEFFREPDAHLGILQLGLSMGQWLCIPMIMLGIYLIMDAKNHVTEHFRGSKHYKKTRKK